MAQAGTEERIYKYLQERGDEGASSADLAAAFLSAAKVPQAIADRIVGALLSGDRRFARGQDCRWRAVAGAAQPGEDVYTVAEFSFAAGAAADRVAVECAVVRYENGKPGEPKTTMIAPMQPLAPGAELPPGLSVQELLKAPPLVKVLEHLAAFGRGTTLVSFEKTPLHSRARHGAEAEVPYLALKQLARRLELIPRDATLQQCTEMLGIVYPEHARAADLAKASAEMLNALLAKLHERGVSGHAQVDDFLRPQYIEVDFSNYSFQSDFFDTLPEDPGVYIMKDANGLPIYVGKSHNLRERVSSYFRRALRLDERVARIRDRVNSITVERVGSELEALLLEHTSIRDLAPELNVAVEVTERPEHYRKEKNIILILPSRAADHVEIFMIRAGERLVTLRVPQSDPESARQPIAELFFADSIPPAGDTDAELLGLVWSWLEKNRDKVNVIDVSAAGTLDNVMRLLADHLRDPDLLKARSFRA